MLCHRGFSSPLENLGYSTRKETGRKKGCNNWHQRRDEEARDEGKQSAPPSAAASPHRPFTSGKPKDLSQLTTNDKTVSPALLSCQRY